VLAGLLLLLVSCGFALRGSDPAVSQLASIRLTATSQYGAVVQAVEKSLLLRDVVVNPGKGAVYHLHLVGERSSRRPVSTTSQISVAEYELRLEIDFQLQDPAGDLVLPLTTMVAERIYSFDRGSFIGNSEEETLLIRDMQADLIERLIDRVAATVQRRIDQPAMLQSP
jgi:LPS-assembly lipoprotein